MPNFLAESKTYVLALAGALVTVAYMLDWMKQDTFLGIMAFLTSGGMATLRAGVAGVQTDVAQGQAVATHQVAQVQADVAHVAAVVEGTPVMPPPPRVLRREP